MLDIIFPSSCIICGNVFPSGCKEVICKDCFERAKNISPPICHYCGLPLKENRGDILCKSCQRPKWNFDQARSYFMYEGIIKKAICVFKYKNNIKIGKWFAGKMGRDVSRMLEGEHGFHIICPVPLSGSKLKERGFNQASILAKDISRILNIPIKFLLRKGKEKHSQVGLDDRRRWSNIQGTFYIKSGQQLKKKRILLIDDVFTTGATVNECARVLKEGGASYVSILTLARAI